MSPTFSSIKVPFRAGKGKGSINLIGGVGWVSSRHPGYFSLLPGIPSVFLLPSGEPVRAADNNPKWDDVLLGYNQLN